MHRKGRATALPAGSHRGPTRNPPPHRSEIFQVRTTEFASKGGLFVEANEEVDDDGEEKRFEEIGLELGKGIIESKK